MNKIKLIRKVAEASTLFLAFVGLFGQIAQAQQRPVSLFSTSCVKGGSGAAYESNQEVSVGREVFTSIFQIRIYRVGWYEGSSITCRIRPASSKPRFKTLRLAFGISDNVERGVGPTNVTVYLDGNETGSRSISSGDKASLLLDVSQKSSVAIEAKCESTTQGCGGVHFFQALLEPISSSPGRRQ